MTQVSEVTPNGKELDLRIAYTFGIVLGSLAKESNGPEPRHVERYSIN